MELVDIYAVEAEALQASFCCLDEVLWAGVVDPLAWTDTQPSAFGGDDQAFGIWVKSLGNQFLRNIWTVGIGGVYKIDAELDGAAQSGDGGGLVGGEPRVNVPAAAAEMVLIVVI